MKINTLPQTLCSLWWEVHAFGGEFAFTSVHCAVFWQYAHLLGPAWRGPPPLSTLASHTRSVWRTYVFTLKVKPRSYNGTLVQRPWALLSLLNRPPHLSPRSIRPLFHSVRCALCGVYTCDKPKTCGFDSTFRHRSCARRGDFIAALIVLPCWASKCSTKNAHTRLDSWRCTKHIAPSGCRIHPRVSCAVWPWQWQYNGTFRCCKFECIVCYILCTYLFFFVLYIRSHNTEEPPRARLRLRLRFIINNYAHVFTYASYLRHVHT